MKLVFIIILLVVRKPAAHRAGGMLEYAAGIVKPPSQAAEHLFSCEWPSGLVCRRLNICIIKRGIT